MNRRGTSLKNRHESPQTFSSLPFHENVHDESKNLITITKTKTTTEPFLVTTRDTEPFHHPSMSSSSSTTIGGPGSGSAATPEFDLLRREATKLERHLEDRVARYQQLAQRMASGDSSFAVHSHSSSKNDGSSFFESSLEAGTLNGYTHNNGASGSGHHGSRDTSGSHSHSHSHHHPANKNENAQASQSASNRPNFDEEESSLSSDIERTISAMSDLVNNQMSAAAEQSGRNQNILLVKRFREILFDCTADFKKTSAAVARRKEAMELFTKNDGSFSDKDKNKGDVEMEHLLRERNAIGNSLKNTAHILGQAEEIRNDLRQQGMSVKGVQGTVLHIAGQVPGINHLIEGIRKKKHRDDVIVSGVISACILFTLWYIFG